MVPKLHILLYSNFTSKTPFAINQVINQRSSSCELFACCHLFVSYSFSVNHVFRIPITTERNNAPIPFSVRYILRDGRKKSTWTLRSLKLIKVTQLNVNRTTEGNRKTLVYQNSINEKLSIKQQKTSKQDYVQSFNDHL